MRPAGLLSTVALSSTQVPCLAHMPELLPLWQSLEVGLWALGLLAGLILGSGSGGKVCKAGLGNDLTFSPQAVHSQPRDAGPAAPGGLCSALALHDSPTYICLVVWGLNSLILFPVALLQVSSI